MTCPPNPIDARPVYADPADRGLGRSVQPRGWARILFYLAYAILTGIGAAAMADLFGLGWGLAYVAALIVWICMLGQTDEGVLPEDAEL